MRKLIKAAVRGMRKRRKAIALIGLPAILLAVNVPPAIAFVKQIQHQMLINSPEYQSQYGRWDVIELPEDLQVNAIHAAMLPTGKLLLIAGSGNDQKMFDAGTFKSLVYDPVTGSSHIVPTPADMFCSGHTFLPDGKLLVAGGTQRYELLPPNVKKAAGAMVVKNEFPDAGRTFEKGTEFVSPEGRKYQATNAFTLPPAEKKIARNGTATVTASQTTVWVESELEGPAYSTETQAQYSINGLAGADAKNFYGLAQKINLDKQDFQGIADTYEFDPFTEQYVKVGDMVHKRWYPSLVALPEGVLSVSGLDGTGQILPGQNEIYDPVKKVWTERPDLYQYFPTYPALLQTAKKDVLFYSGSNAGYGPADKGRIPGFWNLNGNTFQPVTGLRDPELMETSGTAFAGPVQNQKVIVVGGGGVGESPLSTARIDVIDLKAAKPEYKPGPNLPAPTRYPNVVQLPDDSLLISNGSRNYRGRGGSHNLLASLYHPDTNTLTQAADPTVGRDYHSEGILLPNGQVMTMGGNALFRDPQDLKPAQFEKRLEIFTPPYLFNGPQPVVSEAPTEAKLGSKITVSSPQAADIKKARLIRPGAATHVTDLDARTVALDIANGGAGKLQLSIPAEEALVPPGYYMLFLVDAQGRPSVAHWILVR
ncbi:kelch motif-containing protein [Pseudonocardia sp. TRM90224]|uniref:kelch motif-containing protein n=1 Tax=Pseudonocardia sp. TRM90224 TaxID=2812678 RepID=UPI001E44F952|nr:kelch motif-containing protein [Pseudonocardia sp. TRM90224]